jgi:hypothetical protein
MQVFLSCALGAFVGALIALQMAHAFWWVGMLFGAFAGYLVYDLPQIVRAIPTAWKSVQGWEPDKLWWRDYAMSYGGNVLCGLTIIWSLFSFLFLCAVWNQGLVVLFDHRMYNGIPIVAFYIAPILALVFGLIALPGGSWESLEKRRVWCEKDWTLGLRYNPLRFFFYLVPRAVLWVLFRVAHLIVVGATKVPVVIPYILRSVWGAGSFIVRFLIQLFLAIHSKERVLVMTDAAIGAGIGYITGNALFGAVAGGLLGVINYELVSKRWLKLVPAK